MYCTGTVQRRCRRDDGDATASDADAMVLLSADAVICESDSRRRRVVRRAGNADCNTE